MEKTFFELVFDGKFYSGWKTTEPVMWSARFSREPDIIVYLTVEPTVSVTLRQFQRNHIVPNQNHIINNSAVL